MTRDWLFRIPPVFSWPSCLPPWRPLDVRCLWASYGPEPNLAIVMSVPR